MLTNPLAGVDGARQAEVQYARRQHAEYGEDASFRMKSEISPDSLEMTVGSKRPRSDEMSSLRLENQRLNALVAGFDNTRSRLETRSKNEKTVLRRRIEVLENNARLVAGDVPRTGYVHDLAYTQLHEDHRRLRRTNGDLLKGLAAQNRVITHAENDAARFRAEAAKSHAAYRKLEDRLDRVDRENTMLRHEVAVLTRLRTASSEFVQPESVSDSNGTDWIPNLTSDPTRSKSPQLAASDSWEDYHVPQDIAKAFPST